VARPGRAAAVQRRHGVSVAEQRAVRAAALSQPRDPRLPPGFLTWAAGRALAMLILLAAGWAVYACATSERFVVHSVTVHGNVLLTQTDIEAILGVKGINIFWLDRQQAVARLRGLPVVQQADMEASLPDSVEVRIVERQPVAFWTSGDHSYLVDREGVILKAVDADTQQTRACAGQPCDPRLAPLPTVAQLDNSPLAPGEQVESRALEAAARLAAILPSIGVQPVAFDWSQDVGLEVPTRDGWRARFDDSADLDRQVALLQAIRDYLARSKTSVQLIDVRFGDRPYYQ
jgi:POTRA domain, FtsQ-type/Cell division protein FtsQ